MDAQKLHDEWCPNWPDCPGGCGFALDIAAALAAAEARGIERAAQVAEDFDPDGPASPWDVAELIVAAIRALSSPSA